MGSSKWPKQRGEVVTKERWEELIYTKEMKDRQQVAEARRKELKQQHKRRRVEHATAVAAAKRKEQEERSAAKQRASANRNKQPVWHQVDREGQGGVFDKQWEKGEGFWVRTARPPGRGTEWLEGKAAVTSVHEAKRWPEGRSDIRKAVRGRWLEWVADDDSYRQAEGGEVRAEIGSANQPEVGSELREGGTAERREGQDDEAQGHRERSEGGVASSEWNEAPAQPRVRGSSRRHSLGVSAGMASATTTTNGLRMEGRNGRVHLDISGDPAQHLGSGTRSEREEQEDERPTTRAAAKTREIEGRRGQGRTNGRGTVVGEKGTMRRPTGPRQPQGAASAPPHPPQPHQAQPQGKQRSTRSKTGAPTKPREGIG